MAKEKGSGIQQQAGLVRYFDIENDKALKISPKIVIGLAIAASAIVLLLQIFKPM
ncbi:MAG: preprotein translocase subunit Sec61beta [Methanomassiliicoccaceae archaeon]|jgi:preprotein translocase subunit Sec61beta|nr:preprotein translocase subunit Sec61beta [Methanomassiliicoccaceae archaeon]